MLQQEYQFGDRVLHVKRQEWGVGSVTKVEEAIINGQRAQRLTIRFPNAGLKSIIATDASETGAELRKVEDNGQVHLNGQSHNPSGSRLEEWDRMGQSDWLNPLAQRKVRETMLRIPEDCTDAFISLRKRLSNTLALYRFDKSGKGLIDWAVAQSGLDDPLTRFTRQDLEQLYDRWTSERDAHLGKMLYAAGDDKPLLREVQQTAPEAGKQAIRRHFEGR